MKRTALLLCGLLAGCSGNGSPVTPGPSTVLLSSTLSGTVTATNGGQAVAGAQIDAGGRSTITDERGRFSLPDAPLGRLALMISGTGLIPHVLTIDAQSATELALDVITEGSGFDLAFYRQFVRNSLEAPRLGAVRVWPQCCPAFSGSVITFTVGIIDETGATVDPTLVAMARDSITTNTPIWTAGRYTAIFAPNGVPVRWLRANDGNCGKIIGNYEIQIRFRASSACPSVRVLVGHELGHLYGFYHTDSPDDLMYGKGSRATTPSARERYHAAIAYRRPVGNTDADNDP